MSAPSHPRLKSTTATPAGPHVAGQAAPRTAVGARKGVAEGVRTALGSDPRPNDGRRIVAGLHITAPPDWRITPYGRSWCQCGHDEHAIGRAAVARLVEVHAEHRQNCPLLGLSEGRTAA